MVTSGSEIFNPRTGQRTVFLLTERRDLLKSRT